MSKQTAEDLRAAAKLLVEKGWTQGVMARDAQGAGCAHDDKSAASFCALGAIRHSTDLISYHEASAALRSQVSDDSVSQWNDAPGRTAAEVIDALLAAAAAEEARP